MTARARDRYSLIQFGTRELDGRNGYSGNARLTADEVARRSYGKLVAFLAAGTRDVAAAEDALSEAFAAALTEWPRNGSPLNPEAWLLTVARRKALDAGRRQRNADAASGELRLSSNRWWAQMMRIFRTGVLP